jgi:hypothetical protein
MRIREIDVDTERDRLIAFLADNLDHHGGRAHYEWRYLENPDGRARAWAAVEESDPESFIGVAAAFPRSMFVRGERMLCWNLGDFAIRKDHRSLGPAIKLQRACLEPVLAGEVPFAYDHPSCSMMAIYRRMGITQTGEIVRQARVLRIDRRAESTLGAGALAKVVAGTGNFALGLLQRAAGARARDRAAVLGQRFGEEVTELAEEQARDHVVVGARTPEYLNWRYLDHPVFDFEVVTVRQGEAIVGFAAVRFDREDAVLSDLCASSDRDVAAALGACVVDRARSRGVQTLSVPLLASSPILPLLGLPGLIPREKVPFVVSTRAEGELDGIVNRPSNWYLLDGDRDV